MAKYNDDADGKMTFNLNNNNSSNGKKVIVVIALIAAFAIAVIIALTVLIGVVLGLKNKEKIESSTMSSSSTIDNSAYNTASEEFPEKNEDLSEPEIMINSISIDSISDATLSIEKIEIQKISDKITSEGERQTYEVNSIESGVYRFELSDIPNNVWFKMFLYNSDMEQIAYDSGLDNGDGLTCNLASNSCYYVVVEQQGNVGSYSLNIGVQKSTVNISDYTKISDSIQFTNQRNFYEFTSKEKGTYRFELSDIPNNIWFKMFLYNSDMEQLSYDSGLDNGEGLTCYLDQDSKYYVVVEQQGNAGSYCLNIGSQKKTVDISNYSKIVDSVQFTNQRNIYTLQANKGGSYRFELSEISNDVWFKMFIYNSDMEQLSYDSGLDNGEGLSLELNSNSLYYIVVEQQGNLSKYELNILEES